MKFKNLSIGRKITIGFVAIIVLVASMGTFVIIQLSNLSALQDQSFERASDSEKITEASGMTSKLYTVFADVIINRNIEVNKKTWAVFYKEMEEDLTFVRSRMDTEQEKAWIDEAEKMGKQYQNLYNELIELLENNPDEEAIRSLDAKTDALRDEFTATMGKVMESLRKEMEEADKIFDAEAKSVRRAIAITLVLIIALSILFTYALVNIISKPLKSGVQFVERIASGDLSEKLNIDQQDEVGQISTAMNSMVDKLSDIIDQVRTGAENIASASMQMSSSSEQMSQGATEQASSTEEVSSSMEEMVSNIQQNADNAQQTEKIALSAADGIRKVATASEESLKSIREIAGKITIINDIAFQTNILALNAAVEAARAGEHGKGFAVVAAEVRKLAERSKIAAEDISKLSGSSVKITEEAGLLMSKILPDIEKTSKLVQEITASSMEQNSGADQINNAIQQLNGVTQQNAASSEELATSSEELASQAEQLRDTISYFRTGQEASHRRKQPKPQVKKSVPESRKQALKTKITPQRIAKPLGGVQLNLTDGDKLDDGFESM